MVNMNTFSTLHARVKKYRADLKLEKLSSAFAWLTLETILGLNEDEIQDALTDGPQDGGIDAVFIASGDVHVFSFKYAEKPELSDHNFPEDALVKMLATMDGICGKTTEDESVNTALWEKIQEIWNLYDQGPLNFKYYFCSNKQKPADHARRKFEGALKKYERVEFYYYDQEDIVSKMIGRKTKPIDRDIRFVGKEYFQRSDGSLKGIVATVEAAELIKLVRDPEDQCKVNEDIFNDNVRVYLKLKNRINRGIYETALSDDNYRFWYLNNGITIVCDECDYAPYTDGPLVHLKNVQIVNGGQTTHALFEAGNRDASKLRNVLVLMRIYETRGITQISEKISETTNSQTPIRTRDLHANDSIQKRLEDQFRSLEYFYERKKNQHLDQSKSRRLDSELLGQICLAYYLQMASQAKNQKAIVFGDKYDEIFNETMTAEDMLRPYKVYVPLEKLKRELQDKKRRKETVPETYAFLPWATFHVLSVVRVIEEEESLDLTIDENIKYAVDKAIDYLNDLVRIESSERGDDYAHDRFFKEVRTSTHVRDYVLSRYETSRSSGNSALSTTDGL